MSIFWVVVSHFRYFLDGSGSFRDCFGWVKMIVDFFWVIPGRNLSLWNFCRWQQVVGDIFSVAVGAFRLS